MYISCAYLDTKKLHWFLLDNTSCMVCTLWPPIFFNTFSKYKSLPTNIYYSWPKFVFISQSNCVLMFDRTYWQLYNNVETTCLFLNVVSSHSISLNVETLLRIFQCEGYFPSLDSNLNDNYHCTFTDTTFYGFKDGGHTCQWFYWWIYYWKTHLPEPSYRLCIIFTKHSGLINTCGTFKVDGFKYLAAHLSVSLRSKVINEWDERTIRRHQFYKCLI